MPITIIWFAFVFCLFVGIVVNCIYPLFNPRYKMFWTLRKDKYSEAIKVIEEMETDKEILRLLKQASENKQGDKDDITYS